ncbi:MAG TPA: DNA repair protein RecO [Rhabdochlamydiaceae bacterium]|nr:DNA repair protein RecO [Rhabdochlamydiaceae bacterium]
MAIERAEGIVLRSTLYKESHRIISLFTSEAGLISVMVKGVKTPERMALLTPFSQIEVFFRKKLSDLYSLKDGSLIANNLFLREKWDYLETAGKMAQLILHSQMPGKPAPLLYALFLACLKQLPHFEEPAPLLLLFYLKLLTHEGLLSLDNRTLFPIALSADQWETVRELAQSQSFKGLHKRKGLASLLHALEKQLKDLV